MKCMQDASLWPAEDNGFAKRLIQKSAKRLSSSVANSSIDQCDLEQELTVELWQGKNAFDPTRGSWESFATTVVKHSASKLLRNRQAKRRDDRGTVSLNAAVVLPSGEEKDLVHTITNHDRARHICVCAMEPQIRTELTFDLAAVSSTLPQEWQSVLALYCTESNSEVVTSTGMKRSTLYDLKRRICRRLKTDGIEEYFEN